MEQKQPCDEYNTIAFCVVVVVFRQQHITRMEKNKKRPRNFQRKKEDKEKKRVFTKIRFYINMHFKIKASYGHVFDCIRWLSTATTTCPKNRAITTGSNLLLHELMVCVYRLLVHNNNYAVLFLNRATHSHYTQIKTKCYLNRRTYSYE